MVEHLQESGEHVLTSAIASAATVKSFSGPSLSDREGDEDPYNITQSSGSRESTVYGFGDLIVFERSIVWNLD